MLGLLRSGKMIVARSDRIEEEMEWIKNERGFRTCIGDFIPSLTKPIDSYCQGLEALAKRFLKATTRA